MTTATHDWPREQRISGEATHVPSGARRAPTQADRRWPNQEDQEAASGRSMLPPALVDRIRMAGFLLTRGDRSAAQRLLEPYRQYAGLDQYLDSLFATLGLQPVEPVGEQETTRVFHGPVLAHQDDRVLVRLEDPEGRRKRVWINASGLGRPVDVGDLILVTFTRQGSGVMVRTRAAVPPTPEEIREEESRLAARFLAGPG